MTHSIESIYKSSNISMRIKNLKLIYADDNGSIDTCDKYYHVIYIDGGYIKRFEIGSVHNRMEYLDSSLNYSLEASKNSAVINQFEIADYVSLQIVQEANQEGNGDFASTFDFMANSGCSIQHISFDLIDMGSHDSERTTKHYDFNVDWKPDLEKKEEIESDPYWEAIKQSNLNQKIGIDSAGDLYLVISEKYDLKDVFNAIDFIDIPGVIEYDDKFEHHFTPLLAILNPNNLRVLRFDDEKRKKLTIQIDRVAIKLSDSAIEQLGPYLIASALLNAINCCLGGPTYKENESLYEYNIIDTEDTAIEFTPQYSYNKNSLDMTLALGENLMLSTIWWPGINITEFIPELIAEINDELDFWSESNENYKKVLINLMNRLMELFGNKIGLN